MLFVCQMEAAARCKVSKTAYLLGLLRGKRWKAEELFRVKEAPNWPQEASQLLEMYRQSIQRTTSTRCGYPPGLEFLNWILQR